MELYWVKILQNYCISSSFYNQSFRKSWINIRWRIWNMIHRYSYQITLLILEPFTYIDDVNKCKCHLFLLELDRKNVDYMWHSIPGEQATTFHAYVFSYTFNWKYIYNNTSDDGISKYIGRIHLENLAQNAIYIIIQKLGLNTLCSNNIIVRSNILF